MELKLKKKFRSFINICKETAKEINGAYREMTNKMWEIGKIIAEKRKEVNPKYGSGFLAGIANEMESDTTPNALGKCERFHNKFPDLSKRLQHSNLNPSHYIKMAERDLTRQEIEKYEKLASEKEWSARELEERLPTKRPEILQAEAVEAYENFVRAITDMRKSFGRYRKSRRKGILSQSQINGMARTLWIFVQTELPLWVNILKKDGAKIDPNFIRYVEKIKRRL